jgi:hypothetical protein
MNEKELNNIKSIYGFNDDQIKVIKFLSDVISILDKRVYDLEDKMDDINPRPESRYDY